MELQYNNIQFFNAQNSYIGVIMGIEACLYNLEGNILIKQSASLIELFDMVCTSLLKLKVNL